MVPKEPDLTVAGVEALLERSIQPISAFGSWNAFQCSAAVLGTDGDGFGGTTCDVFGSGLWMAEEALLIAPCHI